MTYPIWIAASAATLVLAGPSSPVVQSLRPDNKIVEQKDAPIQVTLFRTDYQKRTNDSPEGIRHEIEYRNRSGKKIVAVQFGLVSFDLWNEFLARTAGLSTEELTAKGRDKGAWLTPTDSSFAFHTAVIYVERVRFESGEIWNEDRELVLTAMRAIQKDFDPANLTPKKPSFEF